MSIVNNFPLTLTNGTTADATQVMALLSWIQSQTNGNACPATSVVTVLKGDGAGGTTAAVAGTDYQAAIPGQVIDFAGVAIPSGYLACDGSAVSRTTYSGLFAALSTTWGVGDGSTTFNVPDLRGRTTIGSGTGTGLSARTLGQQTIGEENHVLITAELAAHNHTINITDPTHHHGFSGSISNTTAGGAGDNAVDFGTNSNTFNAATGITASSVNTGSNTAHNTMQPSAVVQKIIKT
jgi:microcystin-dependent protein